MRIKKINLLYQLLLPALVLMAGGLMTGCKKMVSVDKPINTLLTAVVFENDSTAKLAVTGLYDAITTGNTTANRLFTTSLPALTADEMYYYSSTNYDQFLYNAIPVTDGNSYQLWQEMYQIIYYANAVIEGAAASKGMSANYKSIATGEAKFMRAYMHFQLTNFFGDVPLITTTDPDVTALLPRTPQTTVYQQIISDLTDAQSLLGDNNINSSNRTRINKWTATALLARVYLYNKEYAKAEAQAGNVIVNSTLYSLLPTAGIANVFLANSSEAIWQLYSTSNAGYTYLGSVMIPGSSTFPKYVMTSQLLNAFETGDKRRVNWVGSIVVTPITYYYPYKYKQYTNTTTNIEYLMELRLAEQYLIRAEARAQQNNLGGAQSDINTIRNRAGLGNTTAVTQADVLNAVYKERQTELFAEMGHRWFDLKRTGTIDNVLNAAKTSWKSDAALYPIPQTAINSNPYLKQNNGY